MKPLFRTALAAAALLTACDRGAPAPAAPEAHRVAINGMQVYYEVSGAGEPLIVLHGAYMNIPSMGAIIPKLAESHRVYALELQGHGRTTDIDRPITYPGMADDVAAFMDSVGLTQADVFGYSMGAIAGLQLAIRHPQKVNKLVMASGAYDVRGWQPAFTAFIPQMTVEMIVAMPFAAEYRKLAPNPDGFPALAAKLIQLEKEPMAWEADVRGWQPAFTAFIPQMTVEMIVAMPFAAEYRKLAPNPDGFPALAAKLIQLEKEPMAWEADVRALKTPILIITGDADVATLEHSVALFRILGGGGMGDMGQPLPASRLAVLPATSHTAVITQVDLLHAYIEPFLKGETPKGFFEASQ